MSNGENSQDQSKKGSNEVCLEEVKKHTTRQSLWFVIHNKVYDVTKFMDEHPGGEEVLLEQAGKDASEIFEDVSHSADAKELMQNYLVGILPEHERTVDKSKDADKDAKSRTQPKHFDDAEHSLSLTWTQWVVAVAISIGVGLVVRSMIS